MPTVHPQQESETWHRQSAEGVLTQLRSAANGLSAQEAAERLAANGPNELKEGKRISPLQIFLGQFKSLIIWILIIAGVIEPNSGGATKRQFLPIRFWRPWPSLGSRWVYTP